jgi:hypothetical protein
VTDIAEDKVVLDGNHPLAGIALRFSLTVESVREASDEEVAHGHVHGAHGHHDDEMMVWVMNTVVIRYINHCISLAQIFLLAHKKTAPECGFFTWLV